MTLKFKDNLTMKVGSADNMLRVFINPDRNSNGAQVYATDNAWAIKLNDSIDLTPYFNVMEGKKGSLVAIASNFKAAGQFTVDLVADGTSHPFLNESLPQYTSKQFKVDVEKI